MKKSTKILTGILGFFMFIPGLAKFTKPFKEFIYKQLDITNFPFPEIMQYVVKLSEVGIGLVLIYLAFRDNKLSLQFRNQLLFLGNITIIVMMITAIYVHMHLGVPAEILPMGFKSPVMPVAYIILVVINLYLNRKSQINI